MPRETAWSKAGTSPPCYRERQFVVLKPQRCSRCSILLLPANTARLRHESGVTDPSSPGRSKDSIRQDSQPRRAVCPSRFFTEWAARHSIGPHEPFPKSSDRVPSWGLCELTCPA